MEFKKLRLSGFKSFVEPTELVIETGLTGVVGPNGCGKSNLLEALRWVMGESSYKNMRGSGMDDVIFSGSGGRPARNMADVTVFLDNSGRTAPPAFNDAEMLEITRRIEREAGSAYRINGKDVRARDVQLLFADASTGARSPSLVRQGQIGELISAKPQARRRILEEAAGITGLHTRRHEAELRLRAAETNLTRLEDVTGQIETQLAGLKRQARQARRYKTLSAEIRRAEAIQLHLRWSEAAHAVEAERKALDETTRALGEQTRAASEALRAQEQAAGALPELREEEIKAAAILQRLTIERETLESEERRAQARKGELERRGTQIAEDMARERELIDDTSGVLARLQGEAERIAATEEDDGSAREAAQKALDSAEQALGEREAALDEAAQAGASLKARQRSLDAAIAEQTRRVERLENELARIGDEMAELGGAGEDGDGIDEMRRRADEADSRQAAAEEATLGAEQALAALRQNEQEARGELDRVEREAHKLATEARTLAKLLSVADGDLWPPLVDAVTVEPGFETALGAALGEDLDAPADEAAPVHWNALEPIASPAALPEGAVPLSQVVAAPPALARRLAHVGIVDQHKGAALQGALAPGQRLVSREGDLWRWDGFTAGADAPTAAAQRLAQRNRLGELENEAAEAARLADAARQVFEGRREAVREAAEREAHCRDDWRAATRAAGEAREALARAERAASETGARVSALEQARVRALADLDEARAALEESRRQRAGLEPADTIDGYLETLRAEVAELRAAASQARAQHTGLEREAQTRRERAAAIAEERAAWSERTAKAQAQIETLEQRASEIAEELASFGALPEQWAERRSSLFAALEQAEQRRNAAADALAAAETALGECERRTRQANDAVAESREARARIEARLEAARERVGELTARIGEALHCTPEKVLDHTGLGADDPLPDAAETDARLERLRAERERLGGVNLRAEEESEELSVQLEELVRERDDLVKAINRLRQGIGSLNREGRERLLAAFETVAGHFERLFTHLFGGGTAQLQLTESDDPLDAGLEIMARPPGKRPQTMSLLSGGEQALTAMSLIFAVFLTNPSPICVLDEVDAPLDDANVERFCNLLDEMTRTTDTRFLVITHHALTMSRMDRLFGVTMAERGVSQLVSVDLETAERYREAG